MTEYFNRKSLTHQRRELRNNMTKAEVLLWCALKDRKLEGCKFRRQVSIGKYVVDFFCAELNFGIEVDGDTHYTPEGKSHDRQRQEFLDSLKITIVRITNPDVYDNMDGVWEMLRRTVKELRAQLALAESPDTRTPPGPPL